jgi:RimJ/RimL family protein N-acetyltransferase
MENSAYPVEYIQSVTLRDGTAVTLRPVRREDAPRLQEAFTHLSADTIYMRFLSPLTALIDEQARELATVDYQNRMALVGAIQEQGEERVVAFARYGMVDPNAVDGPNAGLAEVGVVVRDDFQSRGLGTLIIRHLVRYASTHGVKILLATVHLQNERILRFIEQSGVPYQKRLLDGEVWEIRADLTGLDLRL